MSKLQINSKRTWLASVAIIGIAATLTGALAWTAGWIGTRPTSKGLVGQAPASFPPGFRRAHGKGLCFVGTFRHHQDAQALSKARVFTQAEVPVIGRFSIGAGNPHAADNSTGTVSMALLLTTDDQQQWRMALNNQPYFATHDAEGFSAMLKATAADPATGQANPERLAAFLERYPEAKKFLAWRAAAPAPASFSGVEFFGINAFYLVDTQGQRQAVRWSMRSQVPFQPLANEQRQAAPHDFLFDDMRQKLAQQPLHWDLVMQLAQPGDPVDDPSQPWPQQRRQVVAGTLEVTQVIEQAVGACRDVNYDPSIVPAGIEVSNDPVLSARSGAYSHSFNLRVGEIGHGQASEAIGKQEEP
ncbi:catalase family peroxidase [Pseudomonas vanderleydeniana]|uniref:Catalase-related peroxidase n=1 Tax=Pseudomonas vanderleydeniana TaxID=2745495 RepID=A0A9E6TU65_9PSED|nr:catalase family peroxidase [Pseudomonas vanderleydeniana]QXI30539.1 catalase family peroxidase [Pseudomonas vanderleydeniana]